MMQPKPVYQELYAARAFLRYLKAPESKEMQYAVVAWFRQESGSIAKTIGNNPFNIRPGAATIYSVGTRKGPIGSFLVFATLNRGFMAAAVALKAIAPSYGYGSVIRAAQTGNPLHFLAQLANSSWSGSHYGVTARAFAQGMDNHLVVVYRELMA
jgi:hypothetical protein